MSRKLVGFIGYARSGKDTAAQALTSRGWTRVAFADQLKADCGKIIGMPVAAMTPEQKEFWRPLLVEYGRLRRAHHPDYWIWQVESQLKSQVSPTEPVCVTDVRYANECRWVLERNGILIMVTRPGYAAANSEEFNSIMEIVEDDELVNRIRVVPNTGDVQLLSRRVIDTVKGVWGNL